MSIYRKSRGELYRMRMNIALIDDTPSENARMKELLAEYAALSHTELDLHCFTCAEKFLQDYKPFLYTAIFMDIYMEKMSGIQAAELLRRIDSETLLIFLTASPNHMPDAFCFHAYEYITKPVSRERLFHVIDDITKKKTSQENCLSFSSNWQSYSLPYSEIVAVTSSNHRTDISASSGNTYTTRTNFTALYEQLIQDQRFSLIMRGTLVNMDYIILFKDYSCHLETGICLPVNVKNYAVLEQTWKNYVFAKLRRETLEGGFQI